MSKSQTSKAKAKAAAEQTPRASPNDNLELEDFDYKNLKGEMFKQYVHYAGDLTYTVVDEDGIDQHITGQLGDNDSYDYELFRMQPQFKARFPGVKDSPMDLVGLALKSETAIHTTRINVATALNFNKQIDNAHSRAGHGKYYLLKKPM